MDSSVTRLGEFSPIGRLFSFNSFLKITKVANIFWPLFPTVKVYNKFWQKMDWAKFWAIFSQTHLVTLMDSYMLY
jgi:hypothetical protein